MFSCFVTYVLCWTVYPCSCETEHETLHFMLAESSGELRAPGMLCYHGIDGIFTSMFSVWMVFFLQCYIKHSPSSSIVGH